MAAGDFSAADKFEIDRAIRAAEETSRFEFSVFVGHADGEARAYAEGLHAALVAPSYSILVMVDPNARVIEVVTGSVVRRTLTDHEVQLAILVEGCRGDWEDPAQDAHTDTFDARGDSPRMIS